jgi:hypothetical protein
MQDHPMSNGPEHAHHHKRHASFRVRFIRAEVFTVLLGVSLLLVAVALYAGLAGTTTESNEIVAKEYQAVTLTNGQTYYGKIKALNSKYVVLTNVFYIQNNNTSPTTTTTQTPSYTLLKLDTTQPTLSEDKMIINRDTVTIWENLKDTSQIVTKINEYYRGVTTTTTN